MSRARILVCLSLFGLAACNFIPKPPAADDGGARDGKKVGEGCTKELDCREGLICNESKTCQPPANKIEGAPCTLSAECLAGLYCTQTSKCAKSGTAPEGGSCSNEGDCMSGLICAANGLYGACAKAGTADVGAVCALVNDCRAGLVCASGTCQAFGGSSTLWRGAVCPAESGTTAKIHFKIPRSTDPAHDDFYRLPFPNDIHKKKGKIVLSNHPRPGSKLLAFDPVDRFIKALEEDATGFGLNPAVYFRFSKNPDLGTFSKEGAVAIVNISKSAPDYGQKLGHAWSATVAGGRYICPRYIVVRHPLGYPLRGGDTYAVILRRGISDTDGKLMEPDDDFKVMLASAAPVGDADVAAAWSAYAPLRDYLADKKIEPADVVSAAVFTTEKVEEPLAKLREAVRAAPVPEIKNFIKCGAGQMSPCDDGKTGAEHVRGCPTSADAKFDEYQGTVAIPVFQKGTVPYEQPEDGGGIEFDSNGAAKIQRTEDVCVALTVPKGSAPGAGWPLIVYGHGTDGNFRSHVAAGLAGDFAVGEASGGAAAPAATLGYDGIMHGPRKGKSTRPASELVYNLLNPKAARDNALQAAADMFALARVAETFTVGGIKLDKAKMAVYGHSQGANAAAVAAGHEPAFGTVVLSGSGGTLFLAFLHRKNPVNIAAGLPLLLMDQPVDGNHPVISLVQWYFDRSDPVNFAHRIFWEPLTGHAARNMLHIYGTGDTYSPVETQRTLAHAARLQIAGPVLDNYHLQTLTAPYKGTITIGMTAITAAQVQYKPDGYDGHFVSTSHPSARKALREMLATAFRDGLPTVTP